MRRLLLPAVAGALVAWSGAAFADTPVSAATNLNVRAGPGSQYPVIGVLRAGQTATLNGCLQNSKWCTVAEAGGQGWVYSDYLTAEFGGNRVVLTERPANSGIAIVKAPRDQANAAAVAGGATGAIAGAIIGGPVGAAVGGAAGIVGGGAAGTVITPPEQVRTYISEHRVKPVYLQGKVVTGATLPATVALQKIPNYRYRYVYVNDRPVLVEPSTRRIVYVEG
ncbi:hypothetical protein LCM4577_23625 [Mesorhizobium sp. LCM 4577]|uniref:SH3b domain-containing protein n=1 Tax=Mesorhizobium plurifarium TaxID=69974 RepID=A0A090G4R6_MESPL|nr:MULTISPECIES: DUF1236 domain-containing protein [unclassified Mesorhizobium]OHV66768.1 hypothetical protein LCM4576_25960 [Mesorhizobium sp. LCM 4576]OHV69064.1 hypothetical protein LCM4577_23625 [Mesorhizobium sp. LCM 4577]CDX52145.1 conserved exported hypothetical protein [Mesorhizobium plurifarium]